MQVSRFTRLVEVCNHLLGREPDEILNAKGKLVGMDRDVTLDRGSTPLTSTKKDLAASGVFLIILAALSGPAKLFAEGTNEARMTHAKECGKGLALSQDHMIIWF